MVLSGCETALGVASGGEGYLGFSQAFFVAGARSLVLSLWPVDDRATRLLMIRFYESCLGVLDEARGVGGRMFDPGAPLPRAEALREAKEWLRQVSAEDLRPGGARPAAGDTARGTAPSVGPFSDPHYWAAFVLIGDPG